MNSSEYKRWVNLRKNRRAQVTHIYNSRDTFVTLSQVQKRIKVDKLNNLEEELKELDENIQVKSFDETKDESKLNEDIGKCDEYFDGIRECIISLKEPETSSSNIDGARSLLRSPIAPLPTFRSEEGENLIKFLHRL